MTQNTEDPERFEQLLNDFQQLLPSRETQKTFLQISGFPHWETVCSNILAFFFNRRAEHGLDDLFLRSLLEVYDGEFGSSFASESWSIEDKPVREAETEDGKQIDLMIIARPLLVGIENKIHAKADYNPFESYGNHLKKIADEEGIPRRNIVKILLTLNEQTTHEKRVFRPVTYDKFFRQILKNLGNHFLRCEQRHFTFLVDFMNTIKNEQEETEMDLQLRIAPKVLLPERRYTER